MTEHTKYIFILYINARAKLIAAGVVVVVAVKSGAVVAEVVFVVAYQAQNCLLCCC